MASLPLPDPEHLYAAATSRDPAFEGVFVSGVQTTGVYCRPGCPAVMPKRENIRFFSGVGAARSAGFRACKRCHPDRPATTLRWFPDPLEGFVDATHAGPDPLSTRALWTPLGPMIAAARDEGLAFLEFAFRERLERQRRLLRQRFDVDFVAGGHPVLDQVETELREYFDGTRISFETPLALRGTPFQREMWTVLLAVPYGRRRSYGDIARELGRPRATRAVGHANGDNPLTILLPCHRLVRGDGSLCGYGGGLWRKSVLLEHESAHARSRTA